MKRRVEQSPRWASRIIWLAIVLILVVVTSGSGSAQGQGRGRSLFARGAEADSARPQQPERGKKRGRRVRADVTAVTAGDAAGADDILTLNLFDDVELRARRRGAIERPRAGGAVWRGQLLDVPGEATIAVNGSVMAGTVFADDRVFEIVYAGDGEHEVRELDQSQFPTDDPPFAADLSADGPGGAAVDGAVAAGDSAGQIDVMVVWTPAARTAAGGAAAIQSVVDLAVANTNTAYANSNVTQRLRLVYSGEITYTEAAPSTDLSRLASTSDGYLDAVHGLRNTYGADVVTLLGQGYVAGGACGIGFLMTSVSSSFAANAFNVVDRTCAAGNLSYAHELGHNMGLHHDPANASGAGAYSYAYGYQEPSGAFRTVMAYQCPTGSCPRLTRFSNPSLSYNGMPTGTTNHNNTLALNNTANTVANFRQAVGGSCTYSLGASSTSVSSGSSSSSVAVSAGSGCAWSATSNVGWVSITSSSSGMANGSVGFSVQANTAGTTRSGTLTIAGQIFTVNQAAGACGAFSLSPSSQNVGAAGGAASTSVTGTTGCSRTATSNASWIAVTTGATGTGSGMVSTSVAANTSTSSRTGTVTIGGKLFTITQAAAVTTCSYSISPASTSVGSSGGSGSFTLTTQDACAATATTTSSWIAIVSGGSGTGSRTVVFNFAANTGNQRTGTINIGGRVFSVTQAKRNGKPANAAKADFSGDQLADLLWQHTDGTVALWTMNGVTATATQLLTPARVDPAWRMVGSGDLDGNGDPEIVWQHTDGWLLAWFMSGTSAAQAIYLTPNRVDSAWKIVGLGDFNNDLRDDLVWQHDLGTVAVWYMNGPTMVGSSLFSPSSVNGNDWQIVGVGDVNGDLKTDLVWQQSSGGLVGAWLMNGVTATSFVLFSPSQVDPATWRLRGVIDLDDDGKTDLLWQSTNGSLVAWMMQGTTAASVRSLNPAGVGSGWRLVGPR